MDPRNFTIGVLSTTAAILLVGVVIVQSQPQVAWASGMTASGGEYVMTVGRDISGDQELLYVIDSGTQRMVVYRFNASRQQIELVQGIELDKLREANAAAGQKQPPGTTKRRRRP